MYFYLYIYLLRPAIFTVLPGLSFIAFSRFRSDNLGGLIGDIFATPEESRSLYIARP